MMFELKQAGGEVTVLCVHVCVQLCVLTTTPNCSGSDKFAYSFLYLAKAFSCSCSGRCFTRFYKAQRGRKGVRSSMEEERVEKSNLYSFFSNSLVEMML